MTVTITDLHDLARELKGACASQSSGDHGYTWSACYPEPSLAVAVRDARQMSLGCEAAIHIVRTPLLEVVIVGGQIVEVTR